MGFGKSARGIPSPPVGEGSNRKHSNITSLGEGSVKHEFARKLRREQTEVEHKLWHTLRDRRFHGIKFRRQQPVGPYIADFICFEAKLIIELDGSQHAFPENAEVERFRTAFLESDGFRVMRFWNLELKDNFDGVMETIRLAVGPLTRD